MSKKVHFNPELDLPSPEITESQARSFCVRALRSAATRLSGNNPDWEEVEVSIAVDSGEYPDYGFHFRAMNEEIEEVDEELTPETYSIEIIYNEPVHAWNGVISAPSFQGLFEQDETIYSEPFDEGEDEEFEEIGQLIVTEKFLFSIFKKSSGCQVIKALDYGYVDDDGDLIDAELCYRTDELTDFIPHEDLEFLFKFDEKLLDTQSREAEQSVVTVYDLEKILANLVKARLVSSRMKAIL